VVVWDAAREDDPANKGVSVVPLSRMAREVIGAVPIIDANHRDHKDYVFSVNGRSPSMDGASTRNNWMRRC
jgi:hypothetical protein